jgi:cullin 3
MIDSEKTEDLARLYRLFIMVPAGLPCLKRSLKESIARRGKEINRTSLGTEIGDVDLQDGGDDERESVKRKGKTRPPSTGTQTLSLALKWVQDVLDLKDKFDLVWKRALQSDRELESALNEVRFRQLLSRISSMEYWSGWISEGFRIFY